MARSILLFLVSGIVFDTAAGTSLLKPAFLPRDVPTCCQVLQNAGIEHIYLPDDAKYTQQIESYWSLTAQLTPFCIIQPKNASEVSIAVTTLVQQTACNFAIRSGGHSSNAGANNIEEGVTIDLALMNTTTYDPTTNLVSIAPAARWLSVYQTLDPLNVSIPGGRLGPVGAGGLLTGGGFSFYLYQRGLACDSVSNFEVVLANGSVVSANADDNADLWVVLKGGVGSNYGVVTRIDMDAEPRAPIWGGERTYPASASDEVVTALAEWTEGIEGYQNGSAVVFWTYKPADGEIVVHAVLTDVGGVEAAPRFDRFLAVPGNASSRLGMTNMSTLALATQAAGYRNVWFTLTFKNDERVLRKAVELHTTLVQEMLEESPDGDFETQCFFQPFPTVVGKHGAERGGNILGVGDITDNAVVWLGSLAVNGVDQEVIARKKMSAWKDEIEGYSRTVGAYIGYRYVNYADQSQDVMASYGEENFRKMMAVSERYDQDRVFQSRVPGGLKLLGIETAF